MSLPPDAKKAYGVVMAIGTKLGERARTDDAMVDAFRAAKDRAAFVALAREKAAGAVPPVLLDQFDALVTDKDWIQWRSRLLLQLKMTRDGGAPAPGHEQGKGVGRP